MKKILLFAIGLTSSSILMAQTNTFPTTGKVGIGTTTPGTDTGVDTKLHIYGTGSSTTGRTEVRVQNTSSTAGARIGVMNNASGGIALESFGTGYNGALAGNQAVHATQSLLLIGSSPVASGGANFISFRPGGFDTTSETVRFTSEGFVGIGTSAPLVKLHLAGSLLLQGTNIDSRFATGNLSYLPNSGRMLVGWNRSEGGGETDFISNQGTGIVGGFAFYNYDNSAVQRQLMVIQGNGSVGIGTSELSGYKLAVNGNIHAKEIRVDVAAANWPDFVFEKEYTPLPLNELEQFVNKYKHLPEIPSAKEVNDSGINVSEMNSKLLKKIEELTLYLIEQNRMILDLQEKVSRHQK